ncbi:MAG TPA: cupin domain-containing protein [Methyloceanibacter sp.]|nr:cupin domain-containing protein [Methyloceanibacter sp.]
MTRTVLQSAPASVAAISPGGMATSQAMDNTLVTPAEIQWGAGQDVLAKGAQVAILYGDPTKDGLFSMRFKLPKGYRVPPRTLSKAGTFTVISGTFRIGMGERVDPTKVRAMPAGSFIALPPGSPHFVSVDEETVVQLNNIGPWELAYSDP